MPNKRDYYEILGLDKGATADDIRKKYKKLAIKWHPDKHVNDSEADKKAAEDKFKEIAEAYAVLSDENKRKQYDMYGFTGGENSGGFNFSNFDMSDLSDLFGNSFGARFNPFSSFFGDGFNVNNNTRTKAEKIGGNLRMKLKLTLEEIYSGIQKKLKFKRSIPCSHCNGTGSADGKETTCLKCGGTGQIINTQRTPFGIQQTISVCPDCHGSGRVVSNKCKHCNGTGLETKEEIINVDVPFGCEFGRVFTFSGMGNYPPNAGKDGVYGDLQVVIDETPHDLFRREGDDLYLDMTIDLPTAILGGTVEIPTLKGNIRMPINSGTQSGKVMRAKGYGMPINRVKNNSNSFGDMYITINVYIPEHLTDDEKKIFEKLKGSKNCKKK